MDLKNRNEISDAMLVELFREGNRTAGEELQRRYVPLVKKLCRLMGLGSAIEDLEQELWCAFFEIVWRYDGRKAKFSTAVKAHLVGRRKVFLRKDGWLEPTTLSFEEVMMPQGQEDRYPILEREEAEDLVRKMKLTEKQQKILELMIEYSDNSAEIGRMLGISQQCAHCHVDRIRKKAKKNFVNRV